ncbi:hypothetical protein NECAME_18356 [Necator americanus]|uniref:Uncharacterized protein n=1 Tax=Necator americanus TaxID=51031 RepID=W2SXS9_NECAM|nr:hypothetical protein NECAME_18356 [Necator americanus]ETN73412.1 hypothetical protein NECAME_18356 [Necator americanus]
MAYLMDRKIAGNSILNMSHSQPHFSNAGRSSSTELVPRQLARRTRHGFVVCTQLCPPGVRAHARSHSIL